MGCGSDAEEMGPQEMGLKQEEWGWLEGEEGRRRFALSACWWFWDERNWECLWDGEREVLVSRHRVDP